MFLTSLLRSSTASAVESSILREGAGRIEGARLICLKAESNVKMMQAQKWESLPLGFLFDDEEVNVFFWFALHPSGELKSFEFGNDLRSRSIHTHYLVSSNLVYTCWRWRCHLNAEEMHL